MGTFYIWTMNLNIMLFMCSNPAMYHAVLLRSRIFVCSQIVPSCIPTATRVTCSTGTPTAKEMQPPV